MVFCVRVVLSKWNHILCNLCVHVKICNRLEMQGRSITWMERNIKATVWVFQTNRICHVWCNFYPGYTCRTTIILEHWKMVVWKLIVSIKQLFQVQKYLPKWHQRFTKNGFKKPVFFLSKSSKFHVVWTIRFCSNYTGMWYKHFFKECRDFRLPISALATVAGKSFNGKFTTKIDFPVR